jgi:hypothetical protein
MLQWIKLWSDGNQLLTRCAVGPLVPGGKLDAERCDAAWDLDWNVVTNSLAPRTVWLVHWGSLMLVCSGSPICGMTTWRDGGRLQQPAGYNSAAVCAVWFVHW